MSEGASSGHSANTQENTDTPYIVGHDKKEHQFYIKLKGEY